MSNQLTPFEAAKQPETLASLLKRDAYRNRFEQVMGARAPQFISSILSLGSTMHDVEPRSVLAACAIAASLNLQIDRNLGYAWIVPYKKNGIKYGSFQLGYRGIIALAQRTAAYERLNAEAVNAEVYKGRDEVGEPIIAWDEIDESKPVAGYAFGFKLKNGFVKTAYWTKEKVMEHAKKYSQSYRAGGDTPWQSHFDSMALKVVIANTLRKWGMLSVELQGAFAEEHSIRKDIDSPAEFPEPADDIQSPKFETTAEPKSDDKQLAAAGLAPAQAPEQPAKKRGRPAKQSQTPESPAPPPTQPAQQPATVPAAESPAVAGTAATAAAPQAQLFESEAYKQLRTCMTQSGITDEEVIRLCRVRGIMTEQQEELLQLSDATLVDLIDLWTTVAGQIRLERRKVQK